jgi:hypothetical protein
MGKLVFLGRWKHLMIGDLIHKQVLANSFAYLPP